MIKHYIYQNCDVHEEATNQLMPTYGTSDTAKRCFSAALLSCCHKSQPPTKRRDSASYLYTVNNACGVG